MQHTIIQYLKQYGDLTFQEKGFCPEDAVALTILTYLKMEGLVPATNRKAPISIKDLSRHPDADRMFADPIYGKSHRHILNLMAQSRRFRQVQLHHYVEWLDGWREVQFAAVTFYLGETSTFVAYRGTDETLIGWKENFNMGFLPSIPSQRRALSYLLHTAAMRKGAIITAGHSKGGNLALYAAIHAPERVQERIRRIYNFDGPGLQASVGKMQKYQRIRNRYFKIVPEDSIIGMLFQKDTNYHVVRSYRHGILQHDVLQWLVLGEHFSYVANVRRRYRYLAIVLNRWIKSLSSEQIASFVEILYRLVNASRVKNVYELLRRPFHVWYSFHTEFLHLENDQQKTFFMVMSRLIRTLFSVKKEQTEQVLGTIVKTEKKEREV